MAKLSEFADQINYCHADKRPLNSALEVDLDFERALKPPPQPTEEFTATLEDLIKQRIADVQFDDPIRRAPPTEELNKELAEMDDKKASKVKYLY